ncbi:radical SAM protein [Streptomyces sp. N2-109]|uniref:Radical SAM protein n=1 Tax=Streptomyces gossypii TaxID=2883101 RepID=A0ABT2JW86_9ACTN|nr:4Fe-4S single cluster domain-containing protein [Streptomyces gossypii]MCT2591580.1 radical SAM protein [Streptomyces gossypii]
MTTTLLSVARTLDNCTVLGPGTRAVIWVQGCPLRCRGCVAAETLPFEGGTPRPVAELTEWLVGLSQVAGGVEGVTLSGGEPFSQAAALVELIDTVRARRPDFSVMAYSGFRYEALCRGDAGRRALLDRLDLLIDGPYVASKHGSLRWRGSANQRVLALSDRYAHVLTESDTSAGIELSLATDGSFAWAGVPPTSGFREGFEAHLAARGFVLHAEARREP